MSEVLAAELITFVPQVLNGRVSDLETIKAELRRILDIAYDVAAENLPPSLRIDP